VSRTRGTYRRPWGGYSRVRVIRTAVIQGYTQLVDFDLMMILSLLGPFFLTMTQLSMPFILGFLCIPSF